jgi:hypothetical protein
MRPLAIALGVALILAGGFLARPASAQTTFFYFPQGYPTVCGENLTAGELLCPNSVTAPGSTFEDTDLEGLRIALDALGGPRTTIANTRFVILVDDRNLSPGLQGLMGDAIRNLGGGSLVYPSRGTSVELTERLRRTDTSERFIRPVPRYEFIVVGEKLYREGIRGQRDSDQAWRERIAILGNPQLFVEHLLDDIPPKISEYIGRYVGQLKDNWSLAFAMYNGALEQFESTLLHASTTELHPEFWETLSTVLSEFVIRQVLGNFPAIAEVSALSIGEGESASAPDFKITDLESFEPIVSAFESHFDSGARAGTVGEFIHDTRERFLARQREMLQRELLVREWQVKYARLPPDLRGGFEQEIRQAIEAARVYAVPSALELEKGLMETWINSHFSPGEMKSQSCAETGGCVEIWFQPDDVLPWNFVRAAVSVRESTKVGDRINRLIERRQESKTTLFGLAVHKRVCIVDSYDRLSRVAPSAVVNSVAQTLGLGEVLDPATPPYQTFCGWLDSGNTVLHEPENEESRRGFRSMAREASRQPLNLAWRIEDNGFL